MTKRVFSQTFGVVAAIIERNNKFLLVKESQKKGLDDGKWSHPAGWVDVGEDPNIAVAREVLEETGYKFQPNNVLGIYSLVREDIATPERGIPHAIKIIYTGAISDKPTAELADDVTETKWFTSKEIYAMDKYTLRDLDIKDMIKDFIAGKRYPLETIKHTVAE